MLLKVNVFKKLCDPVHIFKLATGFTWLKLHYLVMDIHVCISLVKTKTADSAEVSLFTIFGVQHRVKIPKKGDYSSSKRISVHKCSPVKNAYQ